MRTQYVIVVEFGEHRAPFIYGPFEDERAAVAALARHEQRWSFPGSRATSVHVWPLSMPLED